MPYTSYIMENVLFKISYPAEFHAQTAVEAAHIIHAKLKALGKTADDDSFAVGVTLFVVSKDLEGAVEHNALDINVGSSSIGGSHESRIRERR